MTQSTIAKTEVEGATSTLRAFLEDALGTSKEAKVDWVDEFVRWRVQDWRGTMSEFFDIYKYGFTGITVDLLQIASHDFCRGLGIVGKILNAPEVHNMVADKPTTELLSRKPQGYRQAEASTVEKDIEELSGTVMQQELARYVENTVDRLFESAGELYFEDGMESDFSRELVSVVKKYGNLAMGEIGYLITYGRVDDEVAGEALRWLACMDDASTYGWRLWILEKSLSSKSPVVRDGAALGLASMGDAHAIQYIRKAIDEETITELSYDLQGALKEVEVSLDAAPATGNTQV